MKFKSSLQTIPLTDMNRKILLSFIFTLFYSLNSFSQIGGVSASKISAINYLPIPEKTVEFEPTINLFNSSSFFDNNGNTISIDTATASSALNWRITYGVTENFEVAVGFPSNMQGGNASMKTYLFQKDILHVGAMLGFYFPWGNRTYDKNNLTVNDIGNYGFGLISSLEWNDKNSTDINVQVQNNFQANDQLPTNTYFINIDHGLYSKNGKVLWIMGSGYQYAKLNEQIQSKLTLYPGVALEHAENFILVLATSFDVAGKNNSKNIGFGMSLTTMID